MKGLGLLSARIAATTWFAASALAQLDPIVIKVINSSRLAPHSLLVADTLVNCSGFQILLQDKRH